jgi:hypothetical protein
MDWSTRLERAKGIEIREAPDGVVVYDASRDRIHYLNRTAALLLESCDGGIPAADLPAMLAAAFTLESPPAAEVESCLARLLDEGLLLEVKGE